MAARRTAPRLEVTPDYGAGLQGALHDAMSSNRLPTRKRRRLLAAAAALVLLAGLAAVTIGALARDGGQDVSLAPPGPPVATASARATLHVDSEDGSDSASGRSSGEAWRTLRRVAAAQLAPGDHVLLRRGRTWRGTLRLTRSGTPGRPIVVGAYDDGAPPRITRGDGRQGSGSGSCVRLEGSDIQVVDLHLSACRPARAGIESRGDRNVIARLLIDDNEAGVVVDARADANRVRSNTLRDNDRMTVNSCGGAGDYGAYAIALEGATRTEVAYNYAEGAAAESCDYGTDGSMVEIFEGRDARVHHNVSVDNQTFAEVGGGGATGNRFSYNQVFARDPEAATGFVVHGGRGRVEASGTTLSHNSVRLLGSESLGLTCDQACGRRTLRARNNVFAADRAARSTASFDEDHNLFSGRVNFPIGPGSTIADPGWARDGGVKLRTGGPAARAGLGALGDPAPAPAG